ncbi:MAG: phage protease [Paracoccaceae bacterium]
MSKSQDIALMAAIPLPQEDGTVPEWVHILPRSDRIETHAGDGPYSYTSASELIAASMGRKQRIIVDVNHSTFIAGKKGGEAPARGYVMAMEERNDGIWAKVDWTETGRALMADRAYWGISPVFRHDAQGRIKAILNISLTNEPNLRGLTALNMETEMSFMERLAELLGLDASATEDQIAEAIAALKKGGGEDATAMQSQLSDIGVALGLDAESDGAAVLAAAKKVGGDNETIVALQSELTKVTSDFAALQSEISKDRATAFVDAAIEEGRVGLKPVRDRYIAMHQEDPAGTEELIKAMPILGPSNTLATPPQEIDGEIALNSEHLAAARLIGVSAEDYAKTLKAEKEAR